MVTPIVMKKRPSILMIYSYATTVEMVCQQTDDFETHQTVGFGTH